MSLINDFESNLPLSPKELTNWIRKILGEIDGCNIDYTAFCNVCGCNRGTNISNYISASTFDEVYNAINNSIKLNIIDNGHYLNVLAATTSAVPTDDFYAIELVVINTESQCISLTISKMMGDIYLDSKATYALTS